MQVLQVHLEQAMLEMKEHFHYIEKKVIQILEEQKELVMTQLDTDMDLHDRGQTGKALALPPGRVIRRLTWPQGKPRNSVKTDSVWPVNARNASPVERFEHHGSGAEHQHATQRSRRK